MGRTFRADPDLAACIAGKESGFRNVPNAAGASSAGGIWQFIDSTWISTNRRMIEAGVVGARRLTLRDKYDVDENIKAGAWLLATDGPAHWEVWTLGWCP